MRNLIIIAAILPQISQQKYNVAIKKILQPVNQRPALYMKSCPRIQQEGPFVEICMTRYKTLTLSVPSPVTKRAASPSPATAR